MPNDLKCGKVRIGENTAGLVRVNLCEYHSIQCDVCSIDLFSFFLWEKYFNMRIYQSVGSSDKSACSLHVYKMNILSLKKIITN